MPAARGKEGHNGSGPKKPGPDATHPGTQSQEAARGVKETPPTATTTTTSPPPAGGAPATITTTTTPPAGEAPATTPAIPPPPAAVSPSASKLPYDSETDDSHSSASGITAGTGPDPQERYSSFVEVPDSVYDRFSPRRKAVIVAVMSLCSFLTPVSSTAVLSAVPEVAAEFGTTGTVIGISNAFYMFFMGVSPMFWGPLSQTYGRRIINLVTAVLFTACSVGTVFASSLEIFIVWRLLTAFVGTSFILVGSTVISDLYRPTERATAMGWFLLGTVVGPALGPFLAGVIVTFQSWRVIFWMQAGLGALALTLVFFLLPETAYRLGKDDLVGMPRRMKARVLCSMINPLRVVKLFVYPNLTLTGVASAALMFNMYSLLTPIRYVINPRFNLVTPLQSGFFYLAPGCGYLVGTVLGGPYADYMVKRWIARRGGQRVPEDRLRSAIVAMGLVVPAWSGLSYQMPFAAMGLVVPACTLTYGWGLDRDVGGMPLAAVMLFVQGPRASEVVAGNYLMRYMFACLGTATVLPTISAIGVGWFCTLSSALLVISTLGLVATIAWGKGWREKRDLRELARRAERRRAANGLEGGESGPEVKETHR
ncbi:hypothetical protein MAPG_03992 [Magnaporthiopsis poae ATCC 64411]|uniref:Major facilitator superfamily (MFS) profile domain-containing protein n=1 Tax=Magnaporthiopsis poae (strain ATCC 64411 / 73-15) TaxID=644358 RepID=A0A0C4DVI6_MAGP6|nr:hypothetical protein MAPG_03992 [Magnaporthiopsis poae ATCC 64411]